MDHKEKKKQAGELMLTEFFTQVYRCVEILQDYDHLLKHDTPMQCRNNSISCLFRKYGASILSITVIATSSWFFFKRKLDEVVQRNERKQI